MTTTKRFSLVTFLVAVMILAPIAGVIGMGGIGVAVANEEPPEEELVDVTVDGEDVTIWDRSVLPLRADTEDGAVTVDNLWLDVITADGERESANRGSLAVFQAGESVTLTFDGEGTAANTDHYAEEDVQVLTGQVDESIDDLSDVPTSGDELMDALSEDELDDLNENVEFNDPDEREIEKDGTLDYDYQPESGIHLAVIATGDDSLDVDDGDLEISDETTIIGTESLVAHEDFSEVNVGTEAEPGDDITFDVNADELQGDVTHSVVLYDEDAFTGSEMNIKAEEDLSSDFSSEDVTVQHEIESINGVQNVEDGIEVLGIELGEQSHTGVTELADIVGFLASEIDTDEPGTEVIGDEIELDTSTTVVDDVDPDTEITVETLEGWNEGDYRWVHVATGSSSDEIQTNTGVMMVEDEDRDPPRRPSGGGTGGSPTAVFTAETDAPAEVEVDEDAQLDVTISNIGTASGTTDYEVVIDGQTVDQDEIELEVDETVTRHYDFDTTEAGDIDWSVTVDADDASGTLTVVEDDPDPPVDDDVDDVDDDVDDVDDDVDDVDDEVDDDDIIPGFGVVLALIAVLAGAAIAIRRADG
ncbi:CARDB domain-containing protein [Natrialbaceae archaeon AArc-T1-2]|uniref:CARDB domain-containing protein n=1 Tax=Natrialbaceae archaeon AArc-T1-2 TaxID=3053904 RepID=UPI00255AB024|nr:CARDB domain-containing protein [Natrialbaceae archaeon AArc-T1-2]WIV68863.1 PGF-CTERM sorting domain-containing protein [Natrialbaceae archaeon AArc-T1-2]